MPHVGIQRLGPGHRQHNRAEIDERQPLMRSDELHGVMRRKRPQHQRILRDLIQSERGQHHEPDAHHRAEHLADLPRAARLHSEQDADDHHGNRHDDRMELRIHDLQPFDGRKHRNRRRDDAVAEEQTRPGDPDQPEPMPNPGPLGAALRQGHQRKDPALAVIVGAQDQEDVFDRDRQDQRIEHERQHAHDLQLVCPGRREFGQACLQRIKRAGADVAIDNAEDA